MKALGLVSGVTIAAATLASTVAAQSQSFKSIPPLVIKAQGQHFFYQNNGSEFFMRGVAYQQGISSNSTGESVSAPPDPLADPAGCTRDLPALIGLRTNAVRVYAVDPTKNHDQCMSMFADAGIYVILDLSEPMQSINRDQPAWNGPLYQRYISVIDSFQTYNNVLGFFAGNEVSNSYNTTAASAFVKAAVRDSKAYIKQQNYRSIGVGYATYDGPIRDQLAAFFGCGDTTTSIDFWGYNVYSWCGDSDFQTSGYQARTQFFTGYPVPVFFAEYGCNTQGTRDFSEVPTIFGPLMTDVWSGGLVYEYFQEQNNYGLVSASGSSTSLLPDYTSLSSRMASISPSSTDMSAYNPSVTTPGCPGVTSTGESQWLATATPLPPTPNQGLCQCLTGILGCVSSDNDMTSYEDDFDYICGSGGNVCNGITANGTTGQYGAYGMCSPQQQLSFVMNQYYKAHSSQASACSFNGHASTKAASNPSGSCQALIQQAGTDGAGTVPQPTGNANAQASNAAPGTGSGSGSGSGSSSSSSKGAANTVSIPAFDAGLLELGAYVVGAIVTGAGMILL